MSTNKSFRFSTFFCLSVSRWQQLWKLAWLTPNFGRITALTKGNARCGEPFFTKCFPQTFVQSKFSKNKYFVFRLTIKKHLSIEQWNDSNDKQNVESKVCFKYTNVNVIHQDFYSIVFKLKNPQTLRTVQIFSQSNECQRFWHSLFFTFQGS